MENIYIKLVLDEIFGEQCDTSNNIVCETCKYKEDCELINKFINDIKDIIINVVEANTKINNFIAQHIIDTSNAEYKEMIKMVNQSGDNNKQENKFKNVSDDEIYAELKRRKANKSDK